MQRVTKVVKTESVLPEFQYAVVSEEGMVVYNGEIGIRYMPQEAGKMLTQLAARHGPFAIQNARDFVRNLSALSGLLGAEIDENTSQLRFKYAGGNGTLEIPIMQNLSGTAHQSFDWPEYLPVDKRTPNEIPITGEWRTISELITSEGEALWGKVIGIYGSEGMYKSFDHGIYVEGIEKGLPDFYVPRMLIDLGLNDVEYAVTKDENLYLVGSRVTYVCTAVAKDSVIEDMKDISKKFEESPKHKVALNYDAKVWRRASIFSATFLTIEFVAGGVWVRHGSWREKIGDTDAPDRAFTTKPSLLERWAKNTAKHAIATTDQDWYLYGETRTGLTFYGVLADMQGNVNKKAEPATEVNPTVTAEQAPEGETQPEDPLF